MAGVRVRPCAVDALVVEGAEPPLDVRADAVRDCWSEDPALLLHASLWEDQQRLALLELKLSRRLVASNGDRGGDEHEPRGCHCCRPSQAAQRKLGPEEDRDANQEGQPEKEGGPGRE